MDREQAIALLARKLQIYRAMSYEQLRALVGRVEPYNFEASDGMHWQIEIQIIWDEKPNGDIRVLGAIDASDLRAFLPLTDDFIVAPDGTFVGE